MSTLREKLKNISKELPNTSDELITLSEFLSEVIADDVTPEGVAIALSLITYDIQKGKRGKNSFKKEQDKFKFLVKNKTQVLAQMTFFPQIIDQFCSKKFAKEFRKICKTIFSIDPPEKANDDSCIKDYPEYIIAATNWWTDAILAPKLDANLNEDLSLSLYLTICKSTPKYQKEEIKTFRKALAAEIKGQLEENSSLTLRVDYNPCQELRAAGDLIGVNNLIGYPWKTTMTISPEKVIVYNSETRSCKVVWEK